MKKAVQIEAVILAFAIGAGLRAQEATSGFDLRATVSGEASYSHELTDPPRSGAPAAAGFRAVLYPSWKLSENWTASGAIQTVSRPYYYSDFSTQGYGVKADILQANLSYSRFWKDASLVVRLGQMSTAFGAFLLRYDDAVNPLIDTPIAYGYYSSVSILGLMGAQVDATAGKFDMRAQFVNSSPVNPRGVLEKDQYGNWAGGVGYTLKQGFRVGVSSFRGPYLDRMNPYFFPGEAPPRELPATGLGVDVQWGHGPWNVYGEWQKFVFDYHAIPTFREHVGYGEVRRVLSPRWYLATRLGYVRANLAPARQVYEFVAGVRPNRYQLAKIGYEIQQGPAIRGTLGNTASLQLVTSFHILSLARD
jgi:hypothetical protein